VPVVVELAESDTLVLLQVSEPEAVAVTPAGGVVLEVTLIVVDPQQPVVGFVAVSV
jgi:hypothetical protein